MTNKEKYINCFSGVLPSDEIKERILNMTCNKKRKTFKTIAVVFAVLMLFAMAMFTANAATDGALGEKFSEVSKEITEKISIMFNGEVIEMSVKQTVVTDENGNTSIVEIIIPENIPASEDGVDVLELDKIMGDFGKLVIEKENGNSTEYEIGIKTESENYKVVVESD